MPDLESDASTLHRRTFLRRVSGVGAALAAAVLGIPAIRAFASPGFRKPGKEDWVKVADDVSTLDIGTPIKLDFVEATSDAWIESRSLRSVWVFTEDGQKFIAYSGVCTHLGCGYGFDTTKKIFHCPCHHGLFEVKTGKVIGGPPPRPLDTLPVRVQNGELHVQYKSFRAGVAEKAEV